MANTDYFNINNPEKGYGKTAMKIFSKVLHHDIRNGGIAHACAENGRFTENKVSYSRSLSGDEYMFLGEAPTPECQTEADQYISVNGFNKKRSNKTVYCITAITLDIDWHNEPVQKWDINLENVKSCLNEAYRNDRLPVPTLVNFTGRGICIIYSLRDSVPNLKGTSAKRSAKSKSKKTIEFYNAVYTGLMNAYDKELMPIGLSIDRNASDMARLIRKVGTFNTKALTATDNYFASFCKIILYSKESNYNLYELAKYTINRVNTSYYEKSMNLYQKRLNILKRIVEMNDGEVTGHRNFLICHFASTVKNIEGMNDENIFSFNDTFSEPLSESEVCSVIRSVSRKVNKDGTIGYKLTNYRLIEEFGLSDADAKELGIGERRREKERQEARIQKNRKRTERAEYIIRLYKEGKTYQTIAVMAGCSIGTVFNAIKQNSLDTRRNSILMLSSPAMKNIRVKMTYLCGQKTGEPVTKQPNKRLLRSIFKSCTYKVVNIHACESNAHGCISLFPFCMCRTLCSDTS